MNTFHVELITPDKVLFEGEVIRIKVILNNGGIEILANHMLGLGDMVAGKCEITMPDETRKVFASNDGILNIKKDKVVVTSDLLEWEENLEKTLKDKAAHIAAEHQRREESFLEYRLGTVALERAFANLKNDKTIQ